MKRLIGLIVVLTLFTVGVFATVGRGPNANATTVGDTHFQAAFSALVPCLHSSYPTGTNCPGNVNQTYIDNSTSVFTWQRDLLPFVVPAGKELHITDVQFGAKYVNYTGTRSSYLAIDNVLTISDLQGSIHLESPFIVPSGQMVNVSFINNSPEPQWMNGFITGWLVDSLLSVASPTAVTAVSSTSVPAATAVATATRTATPTRTPTRTPIPCPFWWCH